MGSQETLGCWLGFVYCRPLIKKGGPLLEKVIITRHPHVYADRNGGSVCEGSTLASGIPEQEQHAHAAKSNFPANRSGCVLRDLRLGLRVTTLRNTDCNEDPNQYQGP